MSYAYKTKMYCDDCAETIRIKLDREDCNEYPQSIGLDEYDYPQHCVECGEFVENELSSYGYDRIKEEIATDLAAGRNDSIAVMVWAPYYGIELNVKFEEIAVFEGRNCGTEVVRFTSNEPITMNRVAAHFEQCGANWDYDKLELVGSISGVTL